MKTRFYIRENQKKNVIYFEIRNSKTNKRFRISTKYFINNIKDWDTKREMIKSISSTYESSLINQKLSEKKTEILKAINNLESEKITDFNLQKIVNEIFGEQKKIINEKNKKQHDLISYFDYYISHYGKHHSVHTAKPLSLNTIKTMENSKKKINEYLNHLGLRKITFGDIDKDFYYGLVDYLNEKKYSPNYIGTIIGKLKTILISSYNDGLHKNTEFNKDYFAKPKASTFAIYLNEKELQKLINHEIKNDYLDRVRDIFILGCYTALRVSDMVSFLKNPKLHNYEGKDMIIIEQEKTSTKVAIPINSIIKKILEKRNYTFPKYICQQKINKKIKEICKEAGIDEMIEYKEVRGNETKTITKPKYELVSFHTCRRSFCSNTVNRGMLYQDIMVITGHSSEQVFKSYIKTPLEKRASLISQHPFFQ